MRHRPRVSAVTSLRSILPSPFLRRFALSLALVAAPLGAAAADLVFKGPFAEGTLEAPPRHEASGLAASHRSPDLLWTHDDSDGEPVVYAIDTAGHKRGALRITGVKNEDWEDIAAFERDGRAWLLIGDVGDNAAKRSSLRLHLVAEPDPKLLKPDAELSAAPEYTIRFQFEDGARDCESVAVDAAEGAIYLLSKRDSPPRLYRLPLARPTVKIALAKYLGTATHLAGEPANDGLIKRLVGKKFSWPTAMDISADGRLAAVLTYGEPLVYVRQGSEPWVETFKREPMRLMFPGLPQAEAICFSRDGRTLYVASEGITPLVRYTRD